MCWIDSCYELLMLGIARIAASKDMRTLAASFVAIGIVILAALALG